MQRRAEKLFDKYFSIVKKSLREWNRKIYICYIIWYHSDIIYAQRCLFLTKIHFRAGIDVDTYLKIRKHISVKTIIKQRAFKMSILDFSDSRHLTKRREIRFLGKRAKFLQTKPLLLFLITFLVKQTLRFISPQQCFKRNASLTTPFCTNYANLL